MIKKLLLTVFLVLVQASVFGATNTYTGSTTVGGKLLWSTAANWSLGLPPTASDDVVIPSGKTVIIAANAVAKSVSLSGTLSIDDNIYLRVYGDFIVSSTGDFEMGGTATPSFLGISGNYINNGTTNFNKGSVVIAGDLTSNSSSNIQNLGSVVVGGNIVGAFSTNGNGVDEIFVVNINGNIDITSAKFVEGTNVVAGVQPPASDTTLISLVNEFIYGSSCPFVSSTANIASCSGTNATFTVTFSSSPTTGTPTYLWEVNKNDGSGWNTTGVTSATLTLTNVTATMNNYKYRAKITWNGCTKNGNYGVLTVNALPNAPTVATTQPTCAVPTGSVTITAVSGETYSFDSGAYSSTLTYSSLPQASSHTVYAKNASGCISLVTNVVISSLVTNTWTVASSWSTGSVPTADQNIVFAGDYNSASDLSACSCQVTSGAVNINAGNTLTLTNGLTVTAGTMTFKNQSSLVQTNNVANSGNITYIRDISTSIRDTDYTYWSSPVAGFTVGGVSPTTAYFYSYDSSADNWKSEASTTVMTAGKGYIIRGPAPYSGSGLPTPPAVSPFIGVPNNGDIPPLSVTFTNPLNLLSTNPNYGVSYLLGNPYPSALDADKFLFANKTVLDGTLYFWTHNTQMGIGVSNPGTGVYAYSQDDYASYNTTGGVGTGNTIAGATPTDPRIEVVANKPTGKIAAGQGFFATCIASGTVSFKNTMRVAGNNTQFFRKNNTTAKGSIEKNRVWLNLTNTQGAFKQTLVGYITGATNDYDNAFDGESFDGNEFVDFYSVNQNKNLVIQGRALPFDENDQVALGFRTTINGAFTIKIDQVDGVLANQKVFIEDKMTNTVFDLKSGNYTFNTVAGTFNERFVLRYTDKTLGTIENTALENQVLVSNKNKQIRVYSQAESIAKVTIYDLLGRQIYQKDKVNSTELTITSLGLTRQTLIVKTQLQNGQVVNKKVVY